MSASCLMASPGIGFEDLIETRVSDDFVLVHRAANGFGNFRKADAAIDESIDRDFVGGIQDGGKSAANFAGFASELESGKAFGIRLFESETAEPGEIGLDAVARRTVGIRQRI